jgi:uncharacterized protein YceK
MEVLMVSIQIQTILVGSLMLLATSCASLAERTFDRTGPYCGVVMDLSGAVIGAGANSPELLAVSVIDLPISLVVDTIRLPQDLGKASATGNFAPCRRK